MSFSEFKGIWTVKSAVDGELVSHRVAIGGNPGAVKLLCVNDEGGHAFPDPTQCKYNPNPERIEIVVAGNTYVITLARGEIVNEITCGPKPLDPESRTAGNSSTITRGAFYPPDGAGSWTADDNVGGHGGGDGENRPAHQ